MVLEIIQQGTAESVGTSQSQVLIRMKTTGISPVSKKNKALMKTKVSRINAGIIFQRSELMTGSAVWRACNWSLSVSINRG